MALGNQLLCLAANCCSFIADETVTASYMHRSIISIASLEPQLLIARKLLESAEADLEGINKLLMEHPQLEKWAKDIIKLDFHPINIHGLIGLWGVIECTVEDIICEILKGSSAIKDLLTPYVSMEKLDRYISTEDGERKLFRILEQSFRKENSIIGAYVALLNAVNIRISIDQKTSLHLSELNDVRNCMLHRGGVIDEKATMSSPQLRKYAGKKISVDTVMYERYYLAAGEFSKALLNAILKSPYLQPLAVRP